MRVPFAARPRSAWSCRGHSGTGAPRTSSRCAWASATTASIDASDLRSGRLSRCRPSSPVWMTNVRTSPSSRRRPMYMALRSERSCRTASISASVGSASGGCFMDRHSRAAPSLAGAGSSRCVRPRSHRWPCDFGRWLGDRFGGPVRGARSRWRGGGPGMLGGSPAGCPEAVRSGAEPGGLSASAAHAGPVVLHDSGGGSWSTRACSSAIGCC